MFTFSLLLMFTAGEKEGMASDEEVIQVSAYTLGKPHPNVYDLYSKDSGGFLEHHPEMSILSQQQLSPGSTPEISRDSRQGNGNPVSNPVT